MNIKKINYTLNQLVGNDIYLGYHVNNWNPMINYFLLGSYKRVNIFNLNLTYYTLNLSLKVLNNILLKRGSLWVVNENFLFFNKMVEFLTLKKKFKNLFFFSEKWPKGLLSNYRNVGFIKKRSFPHIIFTPNLEKNLYIINEAFILNLPTIGLVDSKENPYHLLYPINANSKSLKSVYFIYLLLYWTVHKSNSLSKIKFWRITKSKIKNYLKIYINIKNYPKVISKIYYLYFYKLILNVFNFILGYNESTNYTFNKISKFLIQKNLIIPVNHYFYKFKKRLKKKYKDKYVISLYIKNTILMNYILSFLNKKFLFIINKLNNINHFSYLLKFLSILYK